MFVGVVCAVYPPVCVVLLRVVCIDFAGALVSLADVNRVTRGIKDGASGCSHLKCGRFAMLGASQELEFARARVKVTGEAYQSALRKMRRAEDDFNTASAVNDAAIAALCWAEQEAARSTVM